MPKINAESEFTIQLKNLIGIVIAVGISVTAYFAVIQRVTFNEHQREIQWDKIRFLEEWVHTFEPSESIKKSMAIQHELQIRIALLEERVDQLEEDLMKFGYYYAE